MTNIGPIEVPTEAEIAADRAAQADRDSNQDAALATDRVAQGGRDTTQDSTVAALSARVDALASQVATLLAAPVPTPARPVGGAVDLSSMGYVTVDQFTGTDSDRLAKMVSAVAAVTSSQKPTLLLPPRLLDLSNGAPLPAVPGLSVQGTGRGTEFGTGTTIKAPAGGLFGAPIGKGRLSFERLSIVGNFMPLLRTSGADGIWSDVMMKSIGIRGGRLLSGAFTRAFIDNIYINGVTSEPGISAYFTDSFLFPGYCTASGTTRPGVPILRIGASMTRMGAPYVTPQGGGGIEIFYSMGGFTIDGGKADSWRRSVDGKAPALGVVPANAGWNIHGTTGLSLRDIWVNNVNGAGSDRGDVIIGPDNVDLIFYHPTFAKTYDKQTALHSGPAIYTESAIRVYDPIAVGGYPKTFVVSGAGKVVCNDPSWQTTAV